MNDHLLPVPRSDPDAPESLAQALGPRLQRTFHLFVVHNPFYLLSALAMFAGCYLLNNSMHMHAGNLAKLILLLAVLNFYEFTLIGLAGHLMKNPVTRRDGKILIVIESLFLLDFAFLNAETILASLLFGSMINLAVFGLALLKLNWMFRLLGLKTGPARQIYLGLQLLLLYAMPWGFVSLHFNSAPELRVYLLWWVLGLLPVCFEMLYRLAPQAMRLQATEPGALAIARLYLLLPFISLLLHVHFDHWVWQYSIYPVFYAPLLLGLSLACVRLEPAPWMPANQLLFFRLALPLLAVLFSGDTPHSLHFTLAGKTVTPLHTIMLGMYFTYGISFFWPYMPLLAAAAGMLVAVRIFGPAPANVWQHSVDWGDRLLDFIENLGAAVWGVISIGASFLLLALGAATSFRKTRTPTTPPA